MSSAQSPEGERLDALLVAFARARPRRSRAGRSRRCCARLAADLGLGDADPLALDIRPTPWTGPTLPSP